jgi:hypothetical protein
MALKRTPCSLQGGRFAETCGGNADDQICPGNESRAVEQARDGIEVTEKEIGCAPIA